MGGDSDQKLDRPLTNCNGGIPHFVFQLRRQRCPYYPNRNGKKASQKDPSTLSVLLVHVPRQQTEHGRQKYHQHDVDGGNNDHDFELIARTAPPNAAQRRRQRSSLKIRHVDDAVWFLENDPFDRDDDLDEDDAQRQREQRARTDTIIRSNRRFGQNRSRLPRVDNLQKES